MTRHLLFALALLLVLELTTTYRIENSHEESHKRFHAHEQKKKDEIKTLDDIDSLMAKMHKRGAVSRQISKAVKDNYGFSVPEADDDELDESDNKATISAYEEQLRDMHEDNIHEDPSSIAELKAIAESLVDECKVNVTRKKEEKLSSALKPLYQLLQHHGPEGIVSDEEFSEAKASELCAACVLRNLCERDDVLNLTNIPGGLSPAKRVLKCRMKIISLNLMLTPKEPKPAIRCDKDAEFRTIDGTCNNLQNPLFGAANTPFGRLLSPAYGDGISSLRVAENGEPLPNTREVSFEVHGSNADGSNPTSNLLNIFFMNFGQYIDHDVTLAEAQEANCEPPEADENPECINIDIPEGDTIFEERDVKFIEMEREAFVTPESKCQLTPREQINTITTYIDASNVYGSSPEVSEALRAPGGLMKVTKHPQDCTLQDLMPPDTEAPCITVDPFRPCFRSGDIRNNENPGLNTVHTIFLRRHNVIARFLGQMTDLDSEAIFQTARKILGAQQQFIVYNEFLPLVLGQHTIDAFDLGLGKGFNYSTCYDKNLDPVVSTAFAVAAYRFGHTLVPDFINRPSQNFYETNCEQCSSKKNFLDIALADFGNPQYLYDIGNGGVDAILRGLTNGSAGEVDGEFASSVQERLIRGPGDLSDLIAINNNRGYERGMPGYTAYRRLCGLPVPRGFGALRRVAGFSGRAIRALRRVFDDVDDIPLFSGGLLERADPRGGLLGATFQCILGEQFKSLKCGDRFWHENEPRSDIHTEATALTPCQLNEIRKTLVSKIICETSDDITAVNRFAFQQTGIKTPCDKLPEVNLEPWMPGFKCEIEESDEW
ncbi:lactoperoxidase-like [Acropora millepora]|uniref:lactoperoxidase-like n=1 Tax=Acropora millepora TaxID=45264 RepID=UPI001CF12B45|nr:lactoperoxidase-like [Acropora millepora]